MVAVVAESMVGGTLSFHRKVIRVKFPESCSSLLSGKFSGASHRLGKLCLDNAFVLIEGHPSIHSQQGRWNQTWWNWRWPRNL